MNAADRISPGNEAPDAGAPKGALKGVPEEGSRLRVGGRDGHGGGHFGVKAQLSTTFLALALLTAIAGAVAWFVFDRIERSVTEITSKSIPEITLALKVAEVSADITLSAPAIMASETQAQRQEQKALLEAAGKELADLINRLNERGIAPDIAGRISDAASKITEQIAIVDQSVENRLALQELVRQKAATLSRAHASLLEALEPKIDDAVFDLVIDSESSNETTANALKSAIATGTSKLNRLVTLRANASLMVNLLRDTAEHAEAAITGPAAAELRRVRSQFAQDLDALAGSEASDGVRQAGQSILTTGKTVAGAKPEATNDADYLGQLEALDEAYDDFLELIGPVIAEARDGIVSDIGAIADQQAAQTTRMIDTGSFKLLYLMSLQAEGNLAAGLLSEVISIVDAERLQLLQERFDTAADQMNRALEQLRSPDLQSPLRLAVDAQLELGRNAQNLFAVRRAQLQEIETGHAALEKSRTQANRLGQAVAEFVVVAEQLSDETAGAAQQTIANGKIVMLLISVSSIAAALLTILLFVGPRLLRPIEQTTQAMTRLADGDTSVEIPGLGRNDEIGHMAEALAVFRDITIEVQESNLREIETARRRLSDAIESISEAFSLYDSDDRLIIANRKYGTLVHPEIADQITPGMKFDEILQMALETGFIEAAVGREAEWKRERLLKHRDPGPPHMMQRTDGTWILVSERKTAEGGVVAVYSDITEMKERENELAEKSQALEQLSSQLSKYLSPQVYQSIFIGEQSAVVASKRKKLTVFFSDLAGFTEVADRLESEDLSDLLNEYLTEMSKIALKHGATIDKYVGDAIMIFFGDPISHGVKQDALNCVHMAIEMQKRLSELSASWSDYGLTEPLKCRMGIATGFCTVGNFGSEDRMDYTIIGGVVNLASRLETIAQAGRILIAAETYNLVHEDIACREGETIKVKGIAYAVKTYLVAEEERAGGSTSQQIAALADRLSADPDLAALSEGDREEASRMLQQLAKKLTKAKG